MKEGIKTHISITKSLNYSCHLLKFGSFGLKILDDIRLTTVQINSMERFLQKTLKKMLNSQKKYKIWTFLQTNKTLTKLSLESRMGKGKGSIYTEALFLKKGSVIFEFHNIKLQQIKEIYKLLQKQISVKLKLIYSK